MARGDFWRAAALVAVCAGLANVAAAHGDVTPQAVDTHELPQLGADWRAENPFRKNDIAVRIGSSAYNQNCARCHGLGAISGGIAPDLRYLPLGDEGDEVFLQRIPQFSVVRADIRHVFLMLNQNTRDIFFQWVGFRPLFRRLITFGQ